MRVLQLGPYSLPHGGIQAHVVALRQFLQDQDVVCDVIDLNQHRKTDGRGVYGPRNAAELLWMLIRLPSDIVHLHIGGNLTTRLLALSLICGWLPGRKSVLTFHSGGYPSSPEGQAANRKTLRGRIVRQFDRVIAVNQEIADVFLKYGCLQKQVLSIPPYSLPHSAPNVELTQPLRDFFANHSPVLLSVGLLEPEYDLPLQIDVLGLIREQFPNAGLIMIGSGSLECELQQRIISTSYAGHVLLTGDLDRQLTLRTIADCDVYLRTTLFDGDSISLREALHFGTHVVASDRAARPAGVRLIPAQNIRALQQAIVEELSAEKARVSVNSADHRNLEAVFTVYKEMGSV